MDITKERPVIQKLKPSSNWKRVFELEKEAIDLAIEIDRGLAKVAPLYVKLIKKIEEAARTAPATDCGLSASPLSYSKVMFQMKQHLKKYGVAMDNGYYGDPNAMRDFKDYITDGFKWLTKFSKVEDKE